jgi:hypothetical protein
MAWYAYCIGEKQAFPALARHRKPVPMESVLWSQWQSGFSLSGQRSCGDCERTQSSGGLQPKVGRGPRPCDRGLLPGIPRSFLSASAPSFTDDESLRKSIRSNQRQFLGNIDKLRGKTEMHLKIFVDDCCGREIEKHLASESVGREPI